MNMRFVEYILLFNTTDAKIPITKSDYKNILKNKIPQYHHHRLKTLYKKRNNPTFKGGVVGEPLVPYTTLYKK